MKKLIYIAASIIFLTSCATSYTVSSSSLNQTQVQITNSNFKNLGTFSGNVSEKRTKASIKNMEGLVSRAKKNLIENARKAGVELTGSRVMTNTSVDVMKNWRRMTVTVSADIIEFTK